jgi:hypothetical protein
MFLRKAITVTKLNNKLSTETRKLENIQLFKREVSSEHLSAFTMTQPEFLKYHKNIAATTKGMIHIYEQRV